VVRQVDLPQIPVDEMRMVLKTNTKAYLQQDYPNHVLTAMSFPKNNQPNPLKRPRHR